MAKINDANFALLNEQPRDVDELEDDASWVESPDESKADLNDFDSIVDDNLLSLCKDSREQNGYNCHAIDFTLHTIVEESCEDELEFYYNKFSDSNENAGQKNDVSPTDMERYFFFGFEDRSNCLEESSSELFSDLSDNLEQELTATKDANDDESEFDVSTTSKLEKYFLSEFMGFNAENKSDSSVGSDSEGKPSPSQRKKKLRARRTPRSTHSSFDNLIGDNADLVEQSNESLDSSESDFDAGSNEVIKCDKLDNLSLVKRKKNNRKRENIIPTISSSLELDISPQKKAENEFNKELLSRMKTLRRTDSFNNWSSDEETNIMMSKMRQFFKTLIAAKANNNGNSNNYFPTEQQKVQFPYLEGELIRLMKTVPGINDQQLRDIVEYLSSEDTRSDSNDSSDFNAFTADLICKNRKRSQDSADCNENINSSIVERSNDVNPFLESKTALMYSDIFKSFIVKSCNKPPPELIVDNNKLDTLRISKNLKTEQLLVNIWQHIGQKLVNLMREEDIGNEPTTLNTENINEIQSSYTIEEEVQIENVPENTDTSLAVVNQQQAASLPRSKSHDILLGGTNRSWHSYSNSALNDNTGETSDCDRFSWRGSFESALLAPEASKNKVLTNCRDNGYRISQWSLLKRGSVDNLWYANVQNRKHLERVQSCGSILGNDKIKRAEVQKMWLSTYITNKSDEDTSFPKTLHEDLCTHSLPRLQSVKYYGNAASNSEIDPGDIQSNVKSARYRSPVMQSNISFTPSTTKKSDSRIRRETTYVNCFYKNMAPSSSLGEFSVSDLNISSSLAPQQSTLTKRNSTYFRNPTEFWNSVNPDHQGKNMKAKGQVEFSIQYNYKINALEIHVVQCKDLASASPKRCTSDPYVKVYILPDFFKCGKRKTKVKRQTLNPVFNETLRFYMPMSKIKKQSIWLTVCNSDLLGRNDLLGEVIVDLEDKIFNKPEPMWYPLQQKGQIVEDDLKYRGNLVVALKFVPNESNKKQNSKNETISNFTKGKLHVLVKEAKYLYSSRSISSCDTFCKSYLLPNRAKSTKQKTHVIKKSFNPMWNFTFVYDDLTINELSKRALELTVWDHDRLISNELIGGVRFSLGSDTNNRNEFSWMESTEREILLWRGMMSRPNFWVEGSVELRSNLNTHREDGNESHHATLTK